MLQIISRLPVPAGQFYKIYPKSISSFSTDTSGLSALVRPITVRTCVGLYPRLHRLKPHLYSSQAPEGLDLTVDYLDTALYHSKVALQENSTFVPSTQKASSSETPSITSFLQKKPSTVKTILAVPGSGGNYTHFAHLVEHFKHQPDVRLLAPNLPDFSHTRKSGRLFWHSNLELVSFLRDFLISLDVRTVDCLLAHSMGVHRVLGLFADPGPISIKSVAFFAAQPLYDLKEKYVNLTKKLFFTFRNELFYNLLGFLRFHKLPQIPVKFEHINDAFLFLVPVLDDEHLQTQLWHSIEKLAAAKKVPVSIVYGTEEKFISPQARERFFAAFGLQPEDVLVVDPTVDIDPEVVVVGKGNLKTNYSQTRIKGIYLKGGGHFAYANYPQYTNRLVENLLVR